VADLVAGLLAAQGIALALFARERTGAGQHVDISMFDGVVSLLSYHASTWLNGGVVPRRTGNRHPTIAPYDTFAVADGELFLAAGNDAQFRRFCGVAKLDALADDPRFATNPARVVHYEALQEIVAAALREQPRAYWIGLLKDAGVPCGEVRNVPDVLRDPQVAARRMMEAVEHATAGVVKVLGVPIALSGTPGAVRTAPPALGQHTDMVLGELGIDAARIGDLRDRGIV
jgi:formyl-CoA transferase/CoA:oxalate CoA-transferase